jgi:hypothetical protein
MPNDVTTATMWARSLDLADMTGSGFPDATRQLDIQNEGLSELYEILVESHEDYVTKESSEISIVSGTESYSLPTDFQKAVQVFLHRSERRYLMDHFELSELDGYKVTPIDSGTVKLFYVPELSLFTNATTDKVSDKIPSLPIGWERLIVLHTAAHLLQREESFEAAQLVMAQKAQEAQRIRDLAEQRTYEGNSVADYSNRWNYAGLDSDRVQGTFRYRILGENIHFSQIEPWGF